MAGRLSVFRQALNAQCSCLVLYGPVKSQTWARILAHSSAGAAPPLAHVLVATDAAVRGIDVALPVGLALLVSYDCPTRKARQPSPGQVGLGLVTRVCRAPSPGYVASPSLWLR